MPAVRLTTVQLMDVGGTADGGKDTSAVEPFKLRFMLGGRLLVVCP